MATIREYFDRDSSRTLSSHSEWQIRDQNGNSKCSIIAKVCNDLEANAKYWMFFMPEDCEVGGVIPIFRGKETSQCILTPDGDSVRIQMGFYSYSEWSSSETLVFTKRIFFYIDQLLNPTQRGEISQLGIQHGFHVIVRDREYAMRRSEVEKPLAFISHDSRDKDALVRQLAAEMSKSMCPVWYDEYSLRIGDSLRASIEKGLKETRKCIVILSPNFLLNEGWGKAEFDSIYTREIIQKNNVLLPVWHNVGVKEVYEYSPRLADRVGLSSQLGVEELARRLVVAVKQH